MPIQSSTPATETNVFKVDIVGNHKKLVPTPTTTRTVIFLDWDDTLLCSSVLSQQGIKLNSSLENHSELVAQLDELSDYMINVLNTAQQYGEVQIITNGETGWVEMSAQKFTPRVVPLLEKVKVVSARSTFEKQHPDSPMKWKFHAFEQSLLKFYTGPACCRNVISFGDSHAEREAIQAVTNGLPFTTTKSIKFAERPSIEQLKCQLELAGHSFDYIVNHDQKLDLCMSL